MRTSAAVVIEPVASTPPPTPPSSANPRGPVEGVGQVVDDGHPALAVDLAGEPTQAIGVDRPRRRGAGHHDLVQHRLKDLEHRRRVLVLQDRNDTNDLGEVEGVLQRRSQGQRTGRVVGRVHQDGGRTAHDLQTSR